MGGGGGNDTLDDVLCGGTEGDSLAGDRGPTS